MRRQNHSCDQCRKAKRACDAPLLTSARRTSTQTQYSLRGSSDNPSLHSESIGHEERFRPCSYCLKTKKHCTRYWARSQLRAGGYNSHARVDAQSGKHHRMGQRAMSRSDAASFHAAGLFDFTQPPSQYQDLFDWDSIAPSLPVISSQRGGSQASLPVTVKISDSASSQAGLPDLLDDSYGDSENSSRGPDSIFSTLTDNDLQTNGPEQPDCAIPAFFQEHPDPGGYVGSSHHAQGVIDETSQNSESLDPTVNWLQHSYNPLSPASAEHNMVFRTDNSFISHNLLRVYHDVFEHSLSCWVSEVSCPYKMPVRSRTSSPRTALCSQSVNQIDGSRLVQEEWGAVWSNRIYSRVIRLDRVAQSRNIIRLTRTEDQAAIKTLHLAIMAFSSQWAHQSRREREKYPSTSDSESQDFDSSDDLAEEFDRLIQRSLWEQARKALDDCAEVECYRVVCAELIFGLTQKPWERNEPVLGIDSSAPMRCERGLRGMNTSLMAQVQSIISKDGPPIFLERAARRVHALKFRFYAVDAGLIKANKDHGGPYELDLTTIISAKDRETAGFVTWLAAMFDTVSASLHQRPVVVTDEDCQHDLADEDSLAEPEYGENSNTLGARRWSINHFIQDNVNGPEQPIRWPCSYDAAARAVTRSGPVKILLYRHVSYLQDAIRRRQRGDPIEHIIQNAIRVYYYWNVTYGVFFRDLIDNYDTVPPRIRSWFFCIHAHWHLAALTLADLIEFVDDNELGYHQAKQERLSSTIVETIRRSSAGELSDLARITTPPDCAEGINSSSPQLPDFHSAVNQGAILTEPWTMILIRAFSKAFIWHLSEAELWQRNRDCLGHGRHNCQGSLTQCVDCVRALWYLGKKSDMARNVAVALSKALAVLKAQHT
ncbi:hypothetical protein F5B20DRAFT_521197 [Whalleya microplaca]|nr:hypothetical protein F5B20DRAFT_521197 [Whalleya microplaca]